MATRVFVHDDGRTCGQHIPTGRWFYRDHKGALKECSLPHPSRLDKVSRNPHP